MADSTYTYTYTVTDTNIGLKLTTTLSTQPQSWAANQRGIYGRTYGSKQSCGSAYSAASETLTITNNYGTEKSIRFTYQSRGNGGSVTIGGSAVADTVKSSYTGTLSSGGTLNIVVTSPASAEAAGVNLLGLYLYDADDPPEFEDSGGHIYNITYTSTGEKAFTFDSDYDTYISALNALMRRIFSVDGSLSIGFYEDGVPAITDSAYTVAGRKYYTEQWERIFYPDEETISATDFFNPDAPLVTVLTSEIIKPPTASRQAYETALMTMEDFIEDAYSRCGRPLTIYAWGATNIVGNSNKSTYKLQAAAQPILDELTDCLALYNIDLFVPLNGYKSYSENITGDLQFKFQLSDTGAQIIKDRLTANGYPGDVVPADDLVPYVYCTFARHSTDDWTSTQIADDALSTEVRLHYLVISDRDYYSAITRTLHASELEDREGDYVQMLLYDDRAWLVGLPVHYTKNRRFTVVVDGAQVSDAPDVAPGESFYHTDALGLAAGEHTIEIKMYDDSDTLLADKTRTVTVRAST